MLQQPPHRIYNEPYKPIVLRDLLSDCGISQREASAALGICESTLRHVSNRGYTPKVRNIQERIEQFISSTPRAIDWLKAQSYRVADVWRKSANMSRHLYLPDHGDRAERGKGSPTSRRRRSRRYRAMQLQKQKEKQIMENGFATLAAYGYKDSPFESVRIKTGDGDILKRIFHMAVNSNAMFSVLAPWGAGKTTAIKMATHGLNAYMVTMESADKERFTIRDIEESLIKKLLPSDDSIPRSREVRALKAKRAMGEAQKDKPVILLLEESHCLHPSTLRALKRIREYEWLGKSPLLSVVLIGQYDKLKSANLHEVRLRADTYKLKGLAPSESAHYIRETVGDHFEADAVKAVADLPAARNFLELQEALIALMESALMNGSKTVSVFDVFSLYGGGLKQLIDKHGISQTALAEAAGLEKTTVNLLVNNRPHTLNPDKAKSAMDALQTALRNMLPQHDDKKLRAVNS